MTHVRRLAVVAVMVAAVGVGAVLLSSDSARSAAQPSTPIRAAFFYPWFDEAWDQGGAYPYTHYTPSLGLYDSSDPDVIDEQVSLATTAGLEAFIASWWGPGHHTDSATADVLARIPQSPNPAFRISVYYEEEGQSDPSPGAIADDLAYLESLFDTPAYLRIDGEPVVFVWADGGDGAGMASRWAQAAALYGKPLHVVLKVYSGYASDPNQPDSWHQYGPASAYSEHLPWSAVVSPGFWHADEATPRLARSLSRFRDDVESMAASGAMWQLVTAWNEWGEGTSVEPADEFGMSYLNVLADELGGAPPPPGCGGLTPTLTGTPGHDDLVGTIGADVIFGLAGNDTIDGLGGNDVICGGAGYDVIKGGYGNDTVDGGIGKDRIVYLGAPSGVTVSLLAGTASGGHGNDTLISIENVTGTGYRDELVGNGVDNRLVGFGGNDTLRGWGGDDALHGYAGDDVLDGGRGNDLLRGGIGSDRANYRQAASAVSVNLATGVSSGGYGADTLTEIEKLWGSNFNDELTGSSVANVLHGQGGNDELDGRGGDDRLYGGPGNDSADGGPGDDTCYAESIVNCQSSPPPPPGGEITFAAGGDFGATSGTDATFASMANSGAEFLLALGDLAYDDATESGWCAYVKSYLGSNFPVELIVGNHEDDDRVDGYIGNFAACLPDRMGSTGTYAAEYFFDVEGIARVIMIGAGNDVEGEKYDYESGNAHYQWLEDTIDDARSEAIPWVIVGMHKPCITAGNKSCEIGTDLYDLLLDKKVDLILHGHDHDYQRSKQLTCATPNTYRSECVADHGGDDRYAKGAGSVFLVVGNTGGGGLTDIDSGDSEIDYLADWHGGNSPDPGRGYALFTLSADRLEVEFVGSTTSYSDGFVID